MSLWRSTVSTALVATVALAGCSSPDPSSGAAGTAGPEAADVAKMNTGPYATAPTPPVGEAGDNPVLQALLEAHRLAAVTVAPWKITPQLDQIGPGMAANLTRPIGNADSLGDGDLFPDPQPGIAARHGFIAGFSTARFGPSGSKDAQANQPRLIAAVLRFPDAASAAAAAQEMAAADRARTPGSAEVALPGLPQALAWSSKVNSETAVQAYTPYESFVLIQSALETPLSTVPLSAKQTVDLALTEQIKSLAGFVPTPAGELARLPVDPSGSLYARTLDNPSGTTPLMKGVWQPKAWLHFEDDPLTAATMFADAGVDWVGQRLATVYRTRNAEAAEAMLGTVVAALEQFPSAHAAAPVPGLPQARCFVRPAAPGGLEPPPTQQRVDWEFKCAAAVDRYVFTVYAADGTDAQQRIAAQWRILAGR